MTNGQRFESLTKEEKLEFLSMYMEHPLVKYIDWKTFYDSTDGNSMHFVWNHIAVNVFVLCLIIFILIMKHKITLRKYLMLII